MTSHGTALAEHIRLAAQLSRYAAERDSARRERDEAREALAAAMLRCSLATDHGDTFDSLLVEMEWQVQRLQNQFATASNERDEARALGRLA